MVHVTDSVKFLEKRLRTKRKVKKDPKINRQRLKLAEISAKISNYDVNSRHCEVIEDTQDIVFDSNFRKLQNRNSSKTRVRKGQKFTRAVCVTLSGMVQGPLRGSRGKFARVDDLLAVRTISSKGAPLDSRRGAVCYPLSARYLDINRDRALVSVRNHVMNHRNNSATVARHKRRCIGIFDRN